jgi:hypothetical protein
MAAEAGDPNAQLLYAFCFFLGEGVAKDAAEAAKWYTKAAEQGNATAQCILGVCYAMGEGTPRDFAQARKWLQLAAADQKHPDAKYELRLLFFRKHQIFEWRSAIVYILGYGLLTYHAITAPFTFNGSGVAAFFAILLGCGAISLLAILVVEKMRKVRDENEPQANLDRMWQELKREPWRLLFIPAEDGFFLLPLLYIGINPVSAAIAGALFAAAHYPSFPWKYCVPKGVAYFFVALWILPYGIWSVVVAHLILDLTLFGLEYLVRFEGKPSWRNLVRALRTD